MRIAMLALFLWTMIGCGPFKPTQLCPAPSTTPETLALQKQMETRIIKVKAETIFPEVINVLMNQGYLIRSANEKLGVIAFFQQWQDPDQGNPSFRQEGTLFMSAAGPEATRVRVMLTTSAKRLEMTGGGSLHGSSGYGTVGTTWQHGGPEDYKQILDLLERNLVK